MPEIKSPRRELHVVSSRIELGDITGRVLFPTPVQGPWLPFLRFADTTTKGGGDDAEGHTHLEEEVLNYIVTGRVEYEDEQGQTSTLDPGTVELLTARDATHHKLKGFSSTEETRWLSVVVRKPRAEEGPSRRIQLVGGSPPARHVGITLERPLVGVGGSVTSTVGLECADIEFREDGRCTCPIGPGRRAVAYVFEGSGVVNEQVLALGAGALLDNVTNLSIQAASGTRLLVSSVPHSTS
jgi:quercetin 2,3-dioxygenase